MAASQNDGSGDVRSFDDLGMPITAASVGMPTGASAIATVRGLADSIGAVGGDSTEGVDIMSSALDQVDPSAAGNSTDYGEAYPDSTFSDSSDTAGNTIFFLAIIAFLAVGLGLGIFLWRKRQQHKAVGAGRAESSKGGIFSKRARPSPLPLSRLGSEEGNLPPYSPYTNGGLNSPYNNNIFSSQFANGGNPVNGAENNEADEKGSEQPPPTPFSPFAPFSPVMPTSQTPVNGGNYTYPPTTRSSLQQSTVMPPPSPIDPEAAQVMGIHKSVLDEAESGMTEEEITRRRARAQRRLERRQRSEEGSIVEQDATSEAPSFRQIARERRI